MLRNKLRPAICTNQRGCLSQGVVPLQKARSHTAHLTINTDQKLNWEVLEHPAHSPDLAPSDFHLFGRQFADDDKVKDAVHERLRIQRRPSLFQWH
jgi:histone-lysine N-methyltransferase SETMAR